MNEKSFRADLHCHSHYSDGHLSPEELIKLAKQRGLQALSITDHDTTLAYQQAIPIAKKEGILLGSGVEFSSHFLGVSVHILGYDYDLDHPAICSFCQLHIERREERNRAILEKLKRVGITLSYDELQGSSTQVIGRPHIAQLMVKKGYVSTEKEAFRLYIGDQASAYCAGRSIGVEQTLSVIHQAGGKAFIAHPHLIAKKKLLKELLKFPFDGIECYYAASSLHQEKRWLKVAQTRGLLVSGGSDFHGMKPYLSLGSSWIDEERFFKIFTKLL